MEQKQEQKQADVPCDAMRCVMLAHLVKTDTFLHNTTMLPNCPVYEVWLLAGFLLLHCMTPDMCEHEACATLRTTMLPVADSLHIARVDIKLAYPGRSCLFGICWT